MVVDPKRPTSTHTDPARDIYTVANIITVLRLILVPIFFAVLLTGDNDVLAFILFALAASTDWLDGQIARRTGTVTQIGAAIDPIVDRLLIAAGVLGLYIENRLPLWILVVLIARDLYLGYGVWRLEHYYHRRLTVTYAGKTTTAVLLAGFSLLILNWPIAPGLGIVEVSWLPGWGSEPVCVGMWFVYVGLVLSVTTAVQYTFRAGRVRHEVNAQRAAHTPA
ncbi:MAG: CDP-alcohol phosphatidyltransferase family protein [Coriobacteriales bacterium]|nr:CDP-alcohol phosphatidyltransferase family protein [Coriobacteriales bacterium]